MPVFFILLSLIVISIISVFEKEIFSFTVGTNNTANEVFHCVHFECPAVTNIAKPNPVEAGENGLGALEKQESSEAEGAADDQNNDLEVAVANAEANADASNKQQAR